MTDKLYFDSEVNVFARRLAEYFCGDAKPNGDDYCEHYAKVEMPAKDGLPSYFIYINFITYGSKKGFVEIGVIPLLPNPSVSLRGILFPSSNFNLSRNFESVASGIARKIVNNPATAHAIKEYNNRVVEYEARQNALEVNLNDILETCPNVSISKNYKPSGGSVRLFTNGFKGDHFNAEMYSNGDVSFERIGSLSKEKAKKIFAILAE